MFDHQEQYTGQELLFISLHEGYCLTLSLSLLVFAARLLRSAAGGNFAILLCLVFRRLIRLLALYELVFVFP